MAGSWLYVALAIWTVVRHPISDSRRETYQPPLTILKPLCGVDPGLYENLRSFCEQDYPVYQVILGVLDGDDPAIRVVERLIADLPQKDLTIVVDDRTIGTNLKVSNLANMLKWAKHDTLVIADSDMRVGRDYLAAVVAPLEDPRVAAVTCLYRGTPVGGIPSVLGTMFVNEWFLPAALIALRFQRLRYCFGATTAVRMHALQAAGGMEAMASFLADDYMLGRLLTERGGEVRLGRYLVENVLLEPNLQSLLLHELRWARTVGSLRPLGYALTVITYPIPLALLFLLLTQFQPVGMAAVALATGLRTTLHYCVRRRLRLPGTATPWLVPVREALSLIVWSVSWLGRRVHWRGRTFIRVGGGRLVLADGGPPR